MLDDLFFSPSEQILRWLRDNQGRRPQPHPADDRAVRHGAAGDARRGGHSE